MVEFRARSRADASNLRDLLQFRARSTPDAEAYTFLHDDSETTLTFGQLDERARTAAVAIAALTEPGDRALLIYPAGLDFIIGFFGCVYAGVLAVPAGYPNPKRPMSRVEVIVEDCDAAIVLSTAGALTALEPPGRAPILAGLRSIATDALDDRGRESTPRSEGARPDVAFLQYSSGSTSDPKGVLVSHANVLHNLEMILQAQGFAPDRDGDPARTSVFWLPPYHDAGLIGGILLPLYEGGHSILFPPASFLQRPLRWLELISSRRAAGSLAPNFAYELCVRRITSGPPPALDLSAWRVAACGAEPVRADTLERFAAAFAPVGFRADAFHPCYGLAEATLFATAGLGPARPAVRAVRRSALSSHRVELVGGDEADARELVGCGRAWCDQEVLIVDPDTRLRCPGDRVGEIWIRGPSVARGYWNRPQESEQTFGARLADSSEPRFLRTGDLGFIVDGDLYITGRLKNIIIVRGVNHYPQDIERTACGAHPALVFDGGAAFSAGVEDEDRVVVVLEADRRTDSHDFPEIIRNVRRAVSEEHELELHAVVLIRQATLPRTTSGKIRRNHCREMYRSRELAVLAEWTAPVHHRVGARRFRLETGGSSARAHRSADAGDVERLTAEIRAWLTDWLVDRENVPADAIDLNRPFAEYGLSSLSALELSRELEDWLDVPLTPVVAWKYPTPAMLARYLARQASDAPDAELAGVETRERRRTVRGFTRLLAQVEALDESLDPAAPDSRAGAGSLDGGR
jgi:acyl-CoA synthetase (AMP-forming)/AMP-acid ligase II/acyl carrier protein